MSVWDSKQTPSGSLSGIFIMRSTLKTRKFQSGIVVHTLDDSNYYAQREKTVQEESLPLTHATEGNLIFKQIRTLKLKCILIWQTLE